LTDNFEWTEGWNLRFGLVKLDPETQERTIRDSGRLYAEIARSNGLSPALTQAYQASPLAYDSALPSTMRDLPLATKPQRGD